MSWKLLLGSLAVIGAASLVAYKRNRPLSFEEYCDKCCEKASILVDHQDKEIIKTILVLAKSGEEEVSAYLYRKHADGRTTKKSINYKPYPLSMCPDHAKDAIIKGEYIIHKF